MARTPSHPALADGVHPFPHEHLLGIAHLKPWEIAFLLDEAEQWVEMNRKRAAKHDERLQGLTQINAFFENSTRTLLSFEIAGKRLGADVVNLGVSGSSVKKGETLLDTALTLNAMHPDMIVIRHGSSGAVQCSRKVAITWARVSRPTTSAVRNVPELARPNFLPVRSSTTS